MSKVAVIIKKWPFSKGEKAKLTWIGEPFKQNNKWMFYAYLKKDKTTKRLLLDWGSVHFLALEKNYTNGNLNNGETDENVEIIDINLNGVKAEYNEKPWEIRGEGFYLKTKSKTFNFYKAGVHYTVPIIEIIRAILAPDKFMLYRILEMDGLENYFTYEVKDRKLNIYFSSEYEAKLLKNEYINHLTWIITNEAILKMFNEVGQGILEKRELSYSFLLNKFSIRARVLRGKKSIRILEIISLNKKRINAEEINIFHPSLEESISSKEPKKRKYVGKNDDGDKEIDNSADGATKDSEQIDTFLLNHEYERLPRINKKKTGIKVARSKEDKNTQVYTIDNDNLRTTADTGGEDIIRGIEFANISQIEEKGELQGFIEILKLLEKRKSIRSIKIIIGELPEGTKGKRFSKLSDGITKRRYIIGEIFMSKGECYSLIEVEREDKALSMLLLEMKSFMKLKVIYYMLLLGLVNESGNWSNDKIEKIEANGINVYRIKHINKSIFYRELHVYKKL
jgi:hypothetical protein